MAWKKSDSSIHAMVVLLSIANVKNCNREGRRQRNYKRQRREEDSYEPVHSMEITLCITNTHKNRHICTLYFSFSSHHCLSNKGHWVNYLNFNICLIVLFETKNMIRIELVREPTHQVWEQTLRWAGSFHSQLSRRSRWTRGWSSLQMNLAFGAEVRELQY